MTEQPAVQSSSPQPRQASQDQTAVVAALADALPPLSFLAKLGQYGLSLTSVLTACLFILGLFYWRGYFYAYHVDTWAIDIPFLRYVVPSVQSGQLMSVIISNYLGIYWLTVAIRASEPVKAQEKALLSGIGMEETFNKLEKKILAFSKSQHLEAIYAGFTGAATKDLKTSFMAVDDAELLESKRELLIQRCNVSESTAGLIRSLSKGEFEGLRPCLVLLKNIITLEALSKGEETQYARFMKELQKYKAKVEPGRVEAWFNSILGWLFWLGFVYNALLNTAIAITTVLGTLIGILLHLAPKRVKGIDNRYILFVLVMSALCAHAYYHGWADAKVRYQGVYVKLKGGSEEKWYRHIFESSKGIYVQDADETGTALKLLLSSELVSVRYAYRDIK